MCANLHLPRGREREYGKGWKPGVQNVSDWAHGTLVHPEHNHLRRNANYSSQLETPCQRCCRVIRYKPPNVTMGLRRVQYLRQCAGLPASPPPMTRPSVLLINRPYSDGRHIIGLDEVYSQVRRRPPQPCPAQLAGLILDFCQLMS